MKVAITLTLVTLLLPALAQESDQENRLALKKTGHDFKIDASPQQCTDVLYTELATGISKDAGGATPRTLRLAPKLYKFTCKCSGGDSTSGAVMVGEQQSYLFHCEAPAVHTPPSPQQGRCDVNRDDTRNIDDRKRIGIRTSFTFAARLQVRFFQPDSRAAIGLAVKDVLTLTPEMR
jgi:hypothetical protein